ncbi:MAG: oligosaccharide repeat unit polymerase, partial [Oscillospiraceae bacterium]|nr:oligosaccharide repeat unit polymerase [Oscillospiraceae bacterium]
MAFLMFLLLAIFLITAYFTGKKDLLSPWFLLCLIFFATFTIVLFNYNNWEVKINERFILYVSTAIISFGLGGLLIKRVCSSTVEKSQSSAKVLIDDANIKRRYPAYLLLLISGGLALIYIYKLLSDVSGAGSFGDRLRKIYDN